VLSCAKPTAHGRMARESWGTLYTHNAGTAVRCSCIWVHHWLFAGCTQAQLMPLVEAV
jgi:hypothetical protein